MEKPAELLTFKDLEDLCKKCFDKREEIEKLEAEAKEMNAELDGLKERLAEYLTDLDKTSYDSSVGKVTIKNIFTVPVPKSPESKEEFFGYLKSRGMFDSLISIHSQTLNAFYKAELEIANQEGKLDFKIPGLDEPYHKRSLSFRRK